MDTSMLSLSLLPGCPELSDSTPDCALVSMVAFITVVHSNGDHWPWTETSETVNQSESFPFSLSDIFPSNVWIKTATNGNRRLMAQDKEEIIDGDFSP